MTGSNRADKFWIAIPVAHAGIALACGVAFTVTLQGQRLEAATPCEKLASLSLPNATITLAVAVEAGPFNPTATASSPGDPKASRTAPRAFCRVAARLKPSSDSDIAIAVWLPASDWNRKFQAVGNGAFTGSIAYPAMLTALGRGYATASTDTGHEGGSA